jgi:methylglyoxal synthase
MIRIALVAHDGKKPEMVSFVLKHKDFLDNEDVHIYTTGTTGGHIEKEGIKVTRLLSGPLGGDAQIAALVATGDIDVVVFFRDPLDKHPHEPDVQMLMRICDVHNVPLVTNRAGGDLMIKGLKS